MPDPQPVQLNLELTDQQAWDLAQFLKRVTFEDVRRRAVSEQDTYDMLAAMSVVRKALAEVGYEPR